MSHTHLQAVGEVWLGRGEGRPGRDRFLLQGGRLILTVCWFPRQNAIFKTFGAAEQPKAFPLDHRTATADGVAAWHVYGLLSNCKNGWNWLAKQVDSTELLLLCFSDLARYLRLPLLLQTALQQTKFLVYKLSEFRFDALVHFLKCRVELLKVSSRLGSFC